MADLVTNILGKLSSYNFFNNLYPGVLFTFLLRNIYGIELEWNNWIEAIVGCYFLGMIMSRLGSIVVEPVFKKFSIIEYISYSNYVKANNTDKIINILSETNNTYRTLLAMFFLLILFGVGIIVNKLCLSYGITFFQDYKEWELLIFFVILFGYSYKKQTAYIYKRVNEVLRQNS